LIEEIGRRHGQSCGSQDAQELEFICCDVRVLFEIHAAVPAYDHFPRLAIRQGELKGRHLRGDPTVQLPGSQQPALGVDSLNQFCDLPVQFWI
jgi:hypothetical protein